MLKTHCDKCDKVVDYSPRAIFKGYSDYTGNAVIFDKVFCQDCTATFNLGKLSQDIKRLVIVTKFEEG